MMTAGNPERLSSSERGYIDHTDGLFSPVHLHTTTNMTLSPRNGISKVFKYSTMDRANTTRQNDDLQRGAITLNHQIRADRVSKNKTN